MTLVVVIIGALQILFVASTAFHAHRKWAADEPNWILLLSELALVFSGLTTIAVALAE